MFRQSAAREAAGRLCTAGEMAGAALDLANDEPAFVTGQVMVVGGGQRL